MLAIIILNYRSYKDTVELIESIENTERDDGTIGIFVVDNASGEEERDKLSCLKDRCELMLLDENRGYAAGNNAGIKRAAELGYDAFLIANSDTRVIDKGTIYRCYKHMKDRKIALLGPRMIDEKGKDVSGYVDDTPMGRTNRHLTDKETSCRGLVGAFMFIDKKVIDTIGFMNEDYFLFLEETDYCARADIKGLKIVYYPKETILHKCSLTTGEVADYYTSRNKFILAREIYGANTSVLALVHFFRSILFSLRVIKEGFEPGRKPGVGTRLKYVWKGYADGVMKVRGKVEL